MGRRGSLPYLFGIKHSWPKVPFFLLGGRETALRGKFVRSYCALLFSGGEEQSRDCFSLALTPTANYGETVQIFEEEARRIFENSDFFHTLKGKGTFNGKLRGCGKGSEFLAIGDGCTR